jgi:phosphoserine phosphatase
MHVPERVAFWDVDGTLLPGSMERRFTAMLRRERLVPTARMLSRCLGLALQIPSPLWYSVKLCYLRGELQTDVANWAERCLEQAVKPSLRASALAVLERHRRLGVTCVLLTGAPLPLAQALARSLDIAEVIAAEPEIVDDMYTGALVRPHPYGIYKAWYAEEWLKRHALGWAETVAIADDYADRYLLTKAGTAIIAPGDARLRRLARDQGWTVLTES